MQDYRLEQNSSSVQIISLASQGIVMLDFLSIEPSLNGKCQSPNVYFLRKETVASRLCLPENKGPLYYVDLKRYEEKGKRLGEVRKWPSAKGKSGNRSTRPRSTASLTGTYSLKTKRIDVRIEAKGSIA